jgi:hypothetical protein
MQFALSAEQLGLSWAGGYPVSDRGIPALIGVDGTLMARRSGISYCRLRAWSARKSGLALSD